MGYKRLGQTRPRVHDFLLRVISCFLGGRGGGDYTILNNVEDCAGLSWAHSPTSEVLAKQGMWYGKETLE